MTEAERIAARALGKALVKELGQMEWHRKGNESECAKRVTEALKRKEAETGIPAIWIKSMMLRIQRGLV